jgi:hypothetical protein
MKKRCSARTNALTTRSQQTLIDHGLEQVLHLARVDAFDPGAYRLLRQHAMREQRACRQYAPQRLVMHFPHLLDPWVFHDQRCDSLTY